MENPADREPARVSFFGQHTGESSADDRAAWKEERRRVREERRARHRAWQFEHHRGHHEESPTVGLLCFAAGIMLLLNTFGLVSWDVWQPITAFWPVILVLIGLKILLGRSVLGRLLLFLAALAALIYVVSFALIAVESPLAQYVPADVRSFILIMPAPGSSFL